MLTAWTEFLKDPESEKVRGLEMTVDEIRQAKDELITMSNDAVQREIYEMRSKILKDKVSALNKAREEGIDYTIQVVKYLKENKSIEEIMKLTDMKLEKIKELEKLFK